MIKKHLEDKFPPPYLDVDKDSSDWRQRDREQKLVNGQKTIKKYFDECQYFLDFLEDNNK